MDTRTRAARERIADLLSEALDLVDMADRVEGVARVDDPEGMAGVADELREAQTVLESARFLIYEPGDAEEGEQ